MPSLGTFLLLSLLAHAAIADLDDHHLGLPRFLSEQGDRAPRELPFPPSPPLPQAIDDLTSSESITITPDSCDDECYEGLIEREGHILFHDASSASTTGYAFYQGGLVDARAYSPLCRGIVKSAPHVACFLLVFEDAIALDDDGERFVQLMESYPNISQWFISGHSLGGATAMNTLIRVKSEAALVPQLGGVVLLAAYPRVTGPSFKHVDPSIEILSISAENDCIVTAENAEISREQIMPEHAVYHEIKGGNHKGFGSYDSSGRVGPFQVECPATISGADQLQQAVELIVDFVC